MKFIFNYLFPLILLIWIAGIIFPFFIYLSKPLIVYLPFLKLFYSPVCHQIPERSFEINNLSFFVCIRCTGIYNGVLLSYLFMLITKIENNFSIRIFLTAIILMSLDVIFYSTGVYNYNEITAFSTGLFAGFTLILFIFPIIKKYFLKKN